MRVVASWQMADKFELKVANAVAQHSPSVAKASVTAKKVAALAEANLSTVSPASKGARGLQAKVLAEIGVKDAGKMWQRKRRAPIDSDIPVFLVVSNNPWSKVFEYGYGSTGNNFPDSHFMAIAKRAARSAGMVMR